MVRTIFISLMLVSVVAGGVTSALAATVPVQVSSQALLTKRVESLKERCLRQVVPQTEDYSCGAAALTTLLHYYYGQALSEHDAIRGMCRLGDQEKIRQDGFSLLDMKKFAEQHHFQATGYRVANIDQLTLLEVPVIALIDANGYKHFVVIRQVKDQYVYLSDPSWGNRRMRLDDFAKVWNKIILMVTGDTLPTAAGLYTGDYQQTSPLEEVIRTSGLLNYRNPMDPSLFFINAPPSGNFR